MIKKTLVILFVGIFTSVIISSESEIPPKNIVALDFPLVRQLQEEVDWGQRDPRHFKWRRDARV